jgi:hypothetical protein
VDVKWKKLSALVGSHSRVERYQVVQKAESVGTNAILDMRQASTHVNQVQVKKRGKAGLGRLPKEEGGEIAKLFPNRSVLVCDKV